MIKNESVGTITLNYVLLFEQYAKHFHKVVEKLGGSSRIGMLNFYNKPSIFIGEDVN